jgi:hypothetical protein
VDLNLCLSLCLCLSLSLSVKRERERVWCEPGHVGVSMLLGLVGGVGYNSQMKVGKGWKRGVSAVCCRTPPPIYVHEVDSLSKSSGETKG